MATIPNIDDILERCIDDIWAEYDQDRNGHLDREECKDFILSTIREMQNAGQGGMPGGSGDSRITTQAAPGSGDFSDEDFEACFRKVDTDNSGVISRDEMLQFIKVVANM